MVCISLFPFLSVTRLELLSTIQEIRGPLRIEGWEGQTFPYLRNLRRIGHPNGTTLSIQCGRQCELSWPISAGNAGEWRAVFFIYTIHWAFWIIYSSYAVQYSLVVYQNNQLQELDLSSLETISGGGVLIVDNPQLCYVGNLSMYLTNPSEQHQCITSSHRRDPQTCSEHMNAIC